MRKDNLIKTITQNIYENSEQSITGQILQDTLLNMAETVFDEMDEKIDSVETSVYESVLDKVTLIIPEFSGILTGLVVLDKSQTITDTSGNILFSPSLKCFVYRYNSTYYKYWYSWRSYNIETSDIYKALPNKVFNLVNETESTQYVFNDTTKNLIPLRSFEVTSELGDSPDIAMSQKEVTELYNQGYKLVGIATPSTTPIALTGNEKVFYIATEEGDYANFGLGTISELSVIKSDNGNWSVEGLGISLILQTSFVGAGDTSVKSNYIEGFVGGRTYRIDIGDYDTTGVSHTTKDYDLFFVTAYDSENNSNIIFRVRCSEDNDDVYDYYVFNMPENYTKLRVGGRATMGVTQTFTFTDVTEDLESYKNEIAFKLSVGESVTLNYRMFPIHSTGVQYGLYKNNIGKDLESVPTIVIPSINNVMINLPRSTYLIRIKGHYKSTAGYGSGIFKNGILTIPIVNVPSQDNEYLSVPSIDDGQMLLSYGRATTVTLYPYERVQYLENLIYNKEHLITNFDSFVSLTMTSGFKQSDSLGKNVFTHSSVVYTYNSSYHKLTLVPIKGFKSLKAVHFRTGGDWGSAFIDKDMKIISVVLTKTLPADAEYNLICDIPENAKYFVYVAWNTLQPKILLENKKQIQDNSDKRIINGDINNSGIVNSLTSVILPPINMDKPFYLKVNEGYEIKSVNLFNGGDATGFQYDINTLFPFQYFNKRVYSNNTIIPQFNVRVVVKRSDRGEISPNEDIIKTLAYVDFASLKRVIPSNFEDFLIFKERLHQLTNIVWKAEKDIYPSNPSVLSESNYKKGRIYVGSPYSEASEFSKYIGQNVSMRTFLSAIKNPRSVMYTERISAENNTSKYGIEYAGLSSFYCNPYYGTVCTGLTGYVADFVNLYISGGYHNGQVPGLHKVEGCTSADIQPMDFIWYQGHCSIVEDVYEDEYGRRQFIVWAEQTFPVALASLYTPAEFDARMEEKTAEVWRYDNWNEITAPMNQPYVQTNMFDYPEPVLIDPYIRIFCGDYPTLCSGDPLFFNVLRDGRFSTMLIYHEDDTELATPVDTIDISSLPHDDIYEDEEDWVKVDYTSNSLTAGKYKARVTDGTEYSGFVHFEIIQIDLSATKTENNTTIIYNVHGGTPYLIRTERKDGMYNYIITEVTSSPITTNWTDYSTAPYIKLYVQGDYGTAVKRILMQ